MKIVIIIFVLISVIFSQNKYNVEDFTEGLVIVVTRGVARDLQPIEPLYALTIHEFIEFVEEDNYYFLKRDDNISLLEFYLPERKRNEFKETLTICIGGGYYSKEFFRTKDFIKYYKDSKYNMHFVVSLDNKWRIVAYKIYNNALDERILVNVEDRSIVEQVSRELGIKDKHGDETCEMHN